MNGSDPGQTHANVVKILEATGDIVGMCDYSGALIYLNLAGRRALFGISADAPLTGCKVSDVYPAWALEIIEKEAIPAVLRDGTWSGETALLTAGKTEIPVHQAIIAHMDESGKAATFSSICRDISERKQKELESIEWANRYDAAVRASGQVLFVWDSTSGGMTYGGDIARLLGYSEEEMSGGIARLRAIVDAEDVAEFDRETARVAELREPFQHEFRARRKDGVHIRVNAQGFFFFDRRGRGGNMVGFLKDVTAEHAADIAIQQRVAERTASLERLAQELQDSARQQEAVARLGQHALAGMPLAELAREAVELAHTGLRADCTTVLEYLPADDCFMVLSDLGWPEPIEPLRIPAGLSSQSGFALTSGKPAVCADFETETRFQISDQVQGAGLRSGISVCIQAGERPLGVLNAFCREPRQYGPDDVSFLLGLANVLTAAIERQRTEEETSRAREEAEGANRAKSEFLSRMSHELRTPLNAILGFTQLLEMEEHTASQAESIQHITRGGQALLGMINEVLDIARIDSGRMQFHLEPVPLDALLREAKTLTTPLAVRHRVELLFGEMPAGNALASTDRERAKQILLNLLSNAVKYNKPGGSVTLRLAHGAGTWRIGITDTGIGIPAENLSRLFVPFERLGQHEGGVKGGSGLGLALCKRLIDAIGGKIGAHSVQGEGSTFWIELPATAEKPEPPLKASPAPQPPRAPGTHSTILYIEDDIANYHLLERILESQKHIRLITAAQGRLGLDLAREHQPALILLDLNLPDISGEHLLRILKSEAGTSHIPVLAVTGEATNDRPEELRALGATDVLLKPYRVQQLLAHLEKLLPPPHSDPGL